MTDPGRLRAVWTLEKQVPYADAAVVGDTVAVPCPTTVDNTYLAVGFEYAGGVKSVLVGPAAEIECDPTLADPDDAATKPRPKVAPRRRPLGRGR